MTQTTLERHDPIRRPAAAASGPPWRALPVLLVGAFLPVLDAFIVNVALATIGHDLRASAAQLELTVSGYGVAYACSLVAGGRLGDRFGRRRIFLSGMAAFTATSVACGLAPSAFLLIVFRIAQGFAAALMFPQVLAAIQAGFEGRDRHRALGFMGATVGAAGAVGQIVGGALVAADIAGLGWRPIFLVNLPLGLVALTVGRRMLPESRVRAAAAVDVGGAATLAATIALLLIPLTLGRADGWPLWTWVCLAAAPVAGVSFVALQRRLEATGRAPLVPLSLLSVRYARLGLAAMLLFATSVGGFMFSVTMVLQEGQGYSALKSGLTMVPSVTAFFVVALATRRLTARFGERLVAGGAAVFALGLVGFAIVVAVSGARLDAVVAAAPLAILGLGWAAAMVPLLGVVLAGLPVERAGLAGGVLSTALQAGLAAGASLVGTVLFSVVGSGGDASRWGAGTVVMAAVVSGLAVATAAVTLRLRAAREVAPVG